MRLLLEDRGLFKIGEVVRETGERVLPTTDAIARLKRSGLIHELAGYLCASRTAAVSAKLWGAD
jgi:hypothetical protein